MLAIRYSTYSHNKVINLSRLMLMDIIVYHKYIFITLNCNKTRKIYRLNTGHHIALYKQRPTMCKIFRSGNDANCSFLNVKQFLNNKQQGGITNYQSRINATQISIFSRLESDGFRTSGMTRACCFSYPLQVLYLSFEK